MDFSASWCPDCRFIDPMLETLDKELSEKVKFFKVSFDKETQLKDTLNIRKIPTLIFYKDGKEVGERLIEPRSIEAIRDAINTLTTAP
ncbi:thioredoxin family protein [uncultured Helicobacter sp.]|uniref:thioredoxin family protein n=1 Tax=uncultured Helicobacter sp. TaxID=175537 RepID=UPI002610FCFE|nr:thioredoxin family protein [uncultured Helicobacter sp.]